MDTDQFLDVDTLLNLSDGFDDILDEKPTKAMNYKVLHLTNEVQVEKEQKRLRNNRASAQRSRERFKEKLLCLTTKNEELMKANAAYIQENRRLLEIIKLMNDNKQM